MKKMGSVVACCILSTVAWAAPSVLIVTDEGGIDAASKSTLRRITEARLRARGIWLVDDARLARPRPLDAETLEVARQANASRIYVLQPSRLGSKVLLALQERDPNQGEGIYEVSLAAHNLEETDRIVPQALLPLYRVTSTTSTNEKWLPLFLLHARVAF